MYFIMLYYSTILSKDHVYCDDILILHIESKHRLEACKILLLELMVSCHPEQEIHLSQR